MNGAPLMVVAAALGHVDTRMVEKHYGHLSPRYTADTIRRAAPKFGIKSAGNVRPLHGRERTSSRSTPRYSLASEWRAADNVAGRGGGHLVPAHPDIRVVMSNAKA